MIANILVQTGWNLAQKGIVEAATRIDNALREPYGAALSSPRIRFNWGFHDAISDRLFGRVRDVVESGPQNILQVSKTYDRFFYEGYKIGASLEVTGERPSSSEEAWVQFVTDYGDRLELWVLQLEGEIYQDISTFQGMDVPATRILQGAIESTKAIFANCPA